MPELRIVPCDSDPLDVAIQPPVQIDDLAEHSSIFEEEDGLPRPAKVEEILGIASTWVRSAVMVRRRGIHRPTLIWAIVNEVATVAIGDSRAIHIFIKFFLCFRFVTVSVRYFPCVFIVCMPVFLSILFLPLSSCFYLIF